MDHSKNWAEFPQDLLIDIQEKLKFSDYIRFCSVCQQWRYIGLNTRSHHKQSLQVLKASNNKLPMLITQTKQNNSGSRDLFSFTEGKTYDLKLPWPYDYRFFGSSLGWLFLVDKTMAISLVNPFTGDSILLPPIEKPQILFGEIWDESIHDYFTVKGLLTSNPNISPNDYMVVVTFGGNCEFAFYKPGYDGWKKIGEKSHNLSDFIFYDDHVFCVDTWNRLVRIDSNSGIVETIIQESTIVHTNQSHPKVAYLVESQDGDLLQIQRFWQEIDEDCDQDCDEEINEDCDIDYLVKTTMFKVFKLVYNEKSSANWVEINDLGDQAIFVGGNQTVSVSTIEFPECRGNCIYFTDDRHLLMPPYKYRGPDLEDSGVFDLKDGTIHAHYNHDSSQKHLLPPIWFVPNLKEINN